MDELSEILNACKKHDRVAQASLYKLLSPRLFAVSLRYMQNRNEAEDVLQEAFVKIFTGLSGFRGEGSFEGWAKKIVVNTALTALKKKQRLSFVSSLEVVEDHHITAEECESLECDNILYCLQLLSPGYRTIINLFLIEGYSHKEIAEKLSISESTSRSQYSRALQALIKVFKKSDLQKRTRNA